MRRDLQRYENHFCPTPRASDELIERELERTYYESGALKSERARERILTRWNPPASVTGEELAGSGCLAKTVMYFVVSIVTVGIAACGAWLSDSLWGALLALLLWSAFVAVRD